MRNLLNPKWLLIFHTLPVLLLFWIFLDTYGLVKSTLELRHIENWSINGIVIGVISIAITSFAIHLIRRKEKINLAYGIAALVGIASYLLIYLFNSPQLLPWSTPRWVVTQNIWLYPITFLMPTLAHALFIVMLKTTNAPEEESIGKNAGWAIGIPLIWFVVFQIIIPRNVYFSSLRYLIPVIGVISVVLFLYFLVRSIFLFTVRKKENWESYRLAFLIPFSIIFPLLGLALNNNHLPFYKSYAGFQELFGDFSNMWFYILAVANGILICLPDFENPKMRLTVFFGRAIGFTYILYFFVVFLPYLPLSVIAIVAFGLGFLMLAPIIMTVLQSSMLADDFEFLTNFYPKKRLIALLLVGMLILPGGVLISFQKDKNALTSALDNVYNPNLAASESQEVNTSRLAEVLKTVRSHKGRNVGWPNSSEVPFLSGIYNRIVLDNLTLSETKISRLENIFFGEQSRKLDLNRRPIADRNSDVRITDIKNSSVYDEKEKTWISSIDFEMTNFDSLWNQGEYVSNFELPPGSWITDYYLMNDSVRLEGILAEKRTAMWIYQQITSTRRDPGILFYLTGNKIAFRVFPFSKKQTRTTGLEIIHKEPFEFEIDGWKVPLGTEGKSIDSESISTADGEVIYLSKTEKGQLPKTTRSPYFHFVLDVSNHKNALKEDFQSRINAFLEKGQLKKTDSKFTFLNSTSTTLADGNWQQNLMDFPNKGGFFLERGIKEILVKNQLSTTNDYPIIVVVTDSIENAILDENFADFESAFPENDRFYNLNQFGDIESYSLLSNLKNVLPELVETDSIFIKKEVYAYPSLSEIEAYLPIDEKPSIILKNPNALPEKLLSNVTKNTSQWEAGLALQGLWQSQILHPENSDKVWLKLVKGSFLKQVMMPVTSFIAVENEMQKATLLKKQKQVLAANKSLDVGEDVRRMSEPDFWIFAGLVLLLFYFRSSIWSE